MSGAGGGEGGRRRKKLHRRWRTSKLFFARFLMFCGLFFLFFLCACLAMPACRPMARAAAAAVARLAFFIVVCFLCINLGVA